MRTKGDEKRNEDNGNEGDERGTITTQKQAIIARKTVSVRVSRGTKMQVTTKTGQVRQL